MTLSNWKPSDAPANSVVGTLLLALAMALASTQWVLQSTNADGWLTFKQLLGMCLLLGFGLSVRWNMGDAPLFRDRYLIAIFAATAWTAVHRIIESSSSNALIPSTWANAWVYWTIEIPLLAFFLIPFALCIWNGVRPWPSR